MPRSPKVQGELVEIRFLLEAASHGLEVARPWGDSLPYDFVVGHRGRFHRVQVKSSRRRVYRGYQVITVHSKAKPYTAEEADFLAAYVIPEQTWYVIPVKEIAGKQAIVVFPSQRPTRGGRFERYREAWHLLQR